jgi:hypothetical protein
MNKQIILKALQSELETVRAAAIQHEQEVFEPAVTKLTDKIKLYFEKYVAERIHSIAITSDSIIIKPFDTTSYGSDITINYKASWRRDGEGAYFDVSSYRPDIDSREDNTQSVFYYRVLAAVANCFQLICEQYKTKWLPVMSKLKNAKDDKYSEIYKIEREIRTCEAEIAELEKEIYNQSGFECTLKPMTNYNSNYDNGDCVYTKTQDAHHIKAHHGRARWDYAYINSFKVVSFPKAKHSKVVLEWKSSSDEKTRKVELNKQRYAEFVTEVYHWQTTGATVREEYVDERVARYNKVDA